MKRYRLTESRLRGMIKEAVKSVLYEVKIDGDPNERLYGLEQNLKSFDGGVSIEDDLAEFIVDNGLSIGDLKQYSGIVNRIDMNKLIMAINSYKKFLDDYERSERANEYRAWAEEQMSNMGFGFEGD